jgi:hypothetical protein
MKQAPNIGKSIVTFAVISTTRTIPVSGARTTPVKNAAIPTTANPSGWMFKSGNRSWQSCPKNNHRAARVHIEIENAWSATLQALQSIEARANSVAFDVAIAKAKASETACAATAECLQMHGGIGMTDEFDIGLFLKRARVDSVLFGDAAFHTDRVATMLGY